MTLTGGAGGSTLTDGTGAYTLASVQAGLNYTVTPSKAARVPGSAGINTVDVLAVQKHFLNIPPALTGCHLAAADVNGPGTDPIPLTSLPFRNSSSSFRGPPMLDSTSSLLRAARIRR